MFGGGRNKDEKKAHNKRQTSELPGALTPVLALTQPYTRFGHLGRLITITITRGEATYEREFKLNNEGLPNLKKVRGWLMHDCSAGAHTEGLIAQIPAQPEE